MIIVAENKNVCGELAKITHSVGWQREGKTMSNRTRKSARLIESLSLSHRHSEQERKGLINLLLFLN